MGSVGREKPFSEWRKEWQSKYGILPSSYEEDFGEVPKMKSLTLSQRRMMEKELDKFIQIFPILRDNKDFHVTISQVDTIQEEEKASGMYFGTTSNIEFKDDFFDKQMYDNDLELKWYGGVLTSWHPQGTNSMSSLSHELGHTLVEKMARLSTTSTGSYGDYLDKYVENSNKLANEITENASKSLNSTHDHLASRLSQYSTKNRKETISEAVADYVANGSKANPYSVAIVKELKKQLKKYE